MKRNNLSIGKSRFRETLARHTTFRIGGPIDEWAGPLDCDDLKRIIKLSNKLRKRIYIMGSGSNLLVADGRIKGIAVHLSGPSFDYINSNGRSLDVGAGVKLSRLLNFCAEHGLSGIEFCAGIPGTVGGAVVMNAGMGIRNPLCNMGNFVNRVTVMDKYGKIISLEKKDIRFGYRSSSLDGYVLLGAELKLAKADKKSVKERIKLNLEKKRKSQDLSRSSAGCVFKNPYNGLVSAGRLIELSGLKGRRIGGAQVSRKHANYIINTGRGRFKDVKKLIELIRKKVNEEFNIGLELEIKIIE